MKSKFHHFAFLLPLIVLAGCTATESSRTIEAPKVAASYQAYHGKLGSLLQL